MTWWMSVTTSSTVPGSPRSPKLSDPPETLGAGGRNTNTATAIVIGIAVAATAVIIVAWLVSRPRTGSPADLGELVSEDCPAEKFLCLGSDRDVPKVNKETGRFEGPIDFIYMFPRYHLRDLPEESEDGAAIGAAAPSTRSPPPASPTS